MKKFIATLKNIWSIEELRRKILLTLGLILVYRVGCYITLPGIDPNAIDAADQPTGILGLLNMFAGGAFSNASIFALGVMPYISASIFMQLAGIVVPQVAKLQKEESGRRKINQWTRYLTVIVTAAQASAYVGYLRNTQPYASAVDTSAFSPLMFWLTTLFVLTAGTMFVMWLGEKITDKGIGNGTSLLIMVGIIARLPHSLLQEYEAKVQTGGLLIFLIEMVAFIAVVIGIILLTQGIRRIPLNFARRILGSSNAAREAMGGTRDFIPLKVNMVGVMPIIFAQALLFIPSAVTGFMADGSGKGFMASLSDPRTLAYNLFYAILVIAFTYFYTAITFNPTEIADNLKRNNSFIPGVKPGEDTSNYISTIMDRITLPGALFLAVAGILPGIAALLGVTSSFSTFYGGTSMLIAVGVILDTLQQIETHLLNRQYDGLMKTGRIMGRQSSATMGNPVMP